MKLRTLTLFFLLFQLVTVMAQDDPLPVSWLDFEVKAVDGSHIKVNWLVLEQNNRQFNIEVSEDLQNFSAIDTLKGAGTTQVARWYEYQFTPIKSGYYYIRIKQEDFDEKFSYSSIFGVSFEKVEIRSEGGEIFFPNPTFGEVYVKSTEFYDGGFVVFDQSGKQVRIAQEPDGTLDFSPLPNGVYTVVNTKGRLLTAQIVKQ